METENEKKVLILVTETQKDDGATDYSIELGKGSNAAQTAFCMAIVINALVTDKYISSSEEMIRLIRKYCGENQEVENDK